MRLDHFEARVDAEKPPSRYSRQKSHGDRKPGHIRHRDKVIRRDVVRPGAGYVGAKISGFKEAGDGR